MEFKFGPMDKQSSTYVPPSAGKSYFTEQALQAGYFNLVRDFGRDDRELILCELENERIREQTIAAEIEVVRRKLLLDDELRMEMALCRPDGFSLSSGSRLRLEPRLSSMHGYDGRYVEQRMALSLERRMGYHAPRGIEDFETLPFLRNGEPKPSEVRSIDFRS